jgi:flagellar assembly protein FliH
VANDYQHHKEKFGTLASTEDEYNHRFSLHPAARKSLGIDTEEHRHLEGKIQQEVEVRFAELREKARKEGYDQGLKEGEQVATDAFFEKMNPQYDRFSQILAEFESIKDEMFHANEHFLINLVFQIARHVVLKELKTDREYVRNLCSGLVEKIGAKDHVKIKIGKSDSDQIEAIRDFLKQQFVDLKNIQIEVAEDILNGGCKVETDLARINASVDTQLEMISHALGEK